MDESPSTTILPQDVSPTSKKKIVIAILIVATVSVVLTLFFFSSIIFGRPEKPNLDTTSLQRLKGTGDISGIKILPSDINFLANEIGAYALHDNPLTKEKPEIEVYISDSNQYFDVTVEKNVPKTVESRARNPDIRIITDKGTLRKVLIASDLNKEVLSSYYQGRVIVVVLKSFDVLLLKGYSEIYNSLNTSSVTGSVANIWFYLLNKLTFFQKEPKGFYL